MSDLLDVVVSCIVCGCRQVYVRRETDPHMIKAHGLTQLPMVAPGSYLCGQCKRGHQPTSRIGAAHMVFKVDRTGWAH